MTILKAAMWYHGKGFSVIPVKPDKKPYIRWEKYQAEKAGLDQIRTWWKKWPSAMVGLVMGEISGMDAVDCDSEAGRDAISEFLPDSFLTPISKTPNGYHFFFKHRPGLSNGVRVLRDTDLRTTGGYVIAPPSKNGKGKAYAWMQGLKISDVEPAPMPDMLFEILQGASVASERSCASIKNGTSLYKNKSSSTGATLRNKNTDATTATKRNIRNISFDEPGRDDTLFHLANHLVKSGMPEESLCIYLDFFGKHCNPPFPEKEIQIKIESALKRSKNLKRNLTAEVREYISATWGNITATNVLQNATFATFEDRKKVRVILGRLVEQGILERVPDKNGVYRKVEADCEPEDWQNACTDSVNIWLPFGLNEMIEIPPGSIILFAGSQDAGKSAVLMNIAKENRHIWNVYYFSSELNAGAFKNRMSKFPDLAINQCNIHFYPRSGNFHDVLKTGKNDLNILDYLEIHSEFYRVSEYLARIHEKLGQGICVVALQKDPQALYGRGGSFTQEKPILSIALDHGKATISKFKGEFKGGNPRGKEYHFKLLDGCRIVKGSGWHMPAPKQ